MTVVVVYKQVTISGITTTNRLNKIRFVGWTNCLRWLLATTAAVTSGGLAAVFKYTRVYVLGPFGERNNC